MSSLLSNTTTNSTETPLDAVQSDSKAVSEESVVTNVEDNKIVNMPLTERQNEDKSSVEKFADAVDEDLTPTQKDVDLLTPDDDGVINVDIAPIKKKRFSINGNLQNMLELNVSDINIVQRLNKALKQLNKLQEDAVATSKKIADADMENDDSLEVVSQELENIDNKMRELVDFIFNAPVSQTCAKDGSMYDMFKGAFRYEHIIESLMKLYESNIKLEYSQMRSRVSKHTNKYTKKRR